MSQRPIDYRRASGDCVCAACGKRYGDHPMDTENVSEIDGYPYPYLHILCNGDRVKL